MIVYLYNPLCKHKSYPFLLFYSVRILTLVPHAVFCYSSKTIGVRLLKVCDFYCQPITHHLVCFLVTRDLSCCHGNPIFNTCLTKK